jgi:hypothetical protein
VTDCEFPRIQLRGSAGFSPASLLTFVGEDARTNKLRKNETHSPRIRGESGLKCNRNRLDAATAP